MRAFAAIIAVQICFVVVVILRIDGLSSAVGLPIPSTTAASLGSFGAHPDRSLHSKRTTSSLLPSCLFVVSTSFANEDDILRQFHTYRDDPTVGLWVNIYDNGSSNTNTNTINDVSPPTITNVDIGNGSSVSVLRSEILGLKPMLWEQVVPQHTSGYDYLYFLDDDMLFDRSVFAFDQFRWLVQRVDAVIASPKIIRNNVPDSERRAAETSRGGGGVTAGRISIKGGKKPVIRGGGNNILRTKTIPVKQGRRRLTSSQGGGWRLNPLGLYKEETTADRLAAIVKVVEIGSFMVKTRAWHFFRENVFIPSSTSDCGPDCIWCRVFEKEGNRFGALPCLRTLHVGIIHTDTKSYTGSRTFAEHNEQCVAAVNAYFDKANEKYPSMEKLDLLQCRDKSAHYISLGDVLNGDNKII